MNAFWLSVFSGSISGFIAFIIFLKGNKTPLTKERYETVVFPVFQILEPHLYQPLTQDVFRSAQNASEIIKNHRSLAGGKLFECASLVSNYSDYDKSKFFLFCWCVEKEFDRSCKSLGIPLRTWRYKFLKKQYPNKVLQALIPITKGIFYGYIILGMFSFFLLAIAAALRYLWPVQ